MHLVLFLDPEGVFRIDIVASPDEHGAAHEFWYGIRPLAEQFSVSVRQLRGGNGSRRKESQLDEENPGRPNGVSRRSITNNKKENKSNVA